MNRNAQIEKMLIDALQYFGKPTLITDVNRYIWNKYENDIRMSDEMLYKWQYQLRWAFTNLKKDGVCDFNKQGQNSLWLLTKKG